MKKDAFFGIIFFLSLILILGLILIFSGKREISKNISQPSTLPIPSITQFPQVDPNKMKYWEESKEKVDCGRMSSFERKVEAEECWRIRFKNCKPAQVFLDSRIPVGETAENLEFYFEILEKKENLCLINVKCLKFTPKEAEGKEMICNLDPQNEFIIEISNLKNCSGELADILRSYQEK